MSMSITDTINKSIAKAARPIFLIGAGIRQSGTTETLRELAEKAKIPILSSMVSQDTVPTSAHYFGYIGSHGLRYANFILSESDLIVGLGNRLAFNHYSETFGGIAQKNIIQVDIENRQSSTNLREVLPLLFRTIESTDRHTCWLNFCTRVKQLLNDVDTSFPVDTIVDIMKQNSGALFVSDVGNNCFWVTRAYAYAFVSNRMLLSKSFAALGCSLPKSIGAYYAARKPIICFTGDQGLLFNIQELHFIAENKLPITIVLLNNASSGMIYSIQKAHKRQNFIHTTSYSGYTIPDFKKVAEAFNVSLLEIAISKEIEPPRLPIKNLCYDFIPNLCVEKTKILERIKKEFYGKFETNRA